MNINLSKKELQELEEIFTAANEALDFHGDYLEHQKTFMKLWESIEEENQK